MKSNTSFIPFIVALLIFAGGLYWYFFTGIGNQPALTTSVDTDDAQTQFQSLFGELASISFNTDIFSDSRFNALVDLTTPVAPESKGRLDPFAAINSTANITNTVTVANTVSTSTTTPRTATSTVTKVKRN